MTAGVGFSSSLVAKNQDVSGVALEILAARIEALQCRGRKGYLVKHRLEALHRGVEARDLRQVYVTHVRLVDAIDLGLAVLAEGVL